MYIHGQAHKISEHRSSRKSPQNWIEISGWSSSLSFFHHCDLSRMPCTNVLVKDVSYRTPGVALCGQPYSRFKTRHQYGHLSVLPCDGGIDSGQWHISKDFTSVRDEWHVPCSSKYAKETSATDCVGCWTNSCGWCWIANRPHHLRFLYRLFKFIEGNLCKAFGSRSSRNMALYQPNGPLPIISRVTTPFIGVIATVTHL